MHTIRVIGAGVLVLALPIAASAATVQPNSGEFTREPGTNTFDGTFVDGTITELPDLNIAEANISVGGGVTGEEPVNAGVTFGVFSDPVVPGATGAAQLLIEVSGSDFSIEEASFDGQPLTFEPILGGSAAALSTEFSDTADLANFSLEFSGAQGADRVQVSLAPVPLPAGIFLMGAALGGFGVIRKLRKG